MKTALESLVESLLRVKLNTQLESKTLEIKTWQPSDNICVAYVQETAEVYTYEMEDGWLKVLNRLSLTNKGSENKDFATKEYLDKCFETLRMDIKELESDLDERIIDQNDFDSLERKVEEMEETIEDLQSSLNDLEELGIEDEISEIRREMREHKEEIEDAVAEEIEAALKVDGLAKKVLTLLLNKLGE